MAHALTEITSSSEGDPIAKALGMMREVRAILWNARRGDVTPEATAAFRELLRAAHDALTLLEGEVDTNDRCTPTPEATS
jgi:hypothetical protein